jgi:hypothetical protein
MFFMDNAGTYRTDYLAGHPSLSGRVLFTSSGEGEADGAVLKENEPGADGSAIQALVAQGYFVRTRADEALVGDTTRRDVAFASGAQIVSTDYPVAEPQVGTGYSAAFAPAGQAQARCNPVAVNAACAAVDISG